MNRPAGIMALVLLASLAHGIGPAQAAEEQLSAEALETIRHIPIQHNGRLKPFDSFAKETLKNITGSFQIGQMDPVESILAIISNPERWQDEQLISVPFVPLREPLGLSEERTHLSYNELVATRKLMRMLPAIVSKQSQDEKLSMLENETMDVYGRFYELSALFTHDLYLVPSTSEEKSPWLQILKPVGHPEDQQMRVRDAWSTFVTDLRENPNHVGISASELSATLLSLNRSGHPAPWRMKLEVFYNQLAPFRVCRIIYFLAGIGLLLGLRGTRPQAAQLGMIALWAAFLLHGAGIFTRVVLGERPPVSNFYETMLWLPFVAVGISLIFERIYRARTIGLAAAILAGIVLLLADHLPLDSSISPVVAVLRSNMWLTIHVLTIVGSYAPLTLATVLAHIYGWLFLTQGGKKHPAFVPLETFLYRSIQVGVVLLASGVMLGAVWANASWGRYWGWDPKETWALITLLWFLAILHGRFVGWLNGIAVALSTITGFFLLLMTYYGVSFYLVGLHSYAGSNAKPLPALLIYYLIAETTFIAWVGFTAFRRKEFA